MAALETLLSRFYEQADVVGQSRALDAFEKRDEPALKEAWRRWIHAQKALRNGDARLALAWLSAGGDLLDELGDPILRAEHASAVASCWWSLDEPRQAVGPASIAWDAWSSIAERPPLEEIVRSARVLLEVLSEPHPAPELSDQEIFLAWMMDRMTLSFIEAANQVMRVYADFRNLPAAQQVAKTFVDWVERFARRGPMKEFSGLLEARILTSLGDVFDRCDDSEGALSVFDDGLARLEGLPEIPEIQHVRGQLLFNGANQLAKLGRQREALARFEESAVLLEKTGDHEAAARCRYANCCVRFKLGELGELEEELAELAGEYEETVESARVTSRLIAARQNLDRIYRLWLRLEADRLDADDPEQVLLLLHHVFALKEEEGKYTGIWRTVRQNPGRKLLSEMPVLIERTEQYPGLGILVIEQVVDALLFVAIRPGPERWLERFALQVVDDSKEIDAFKDLVLHHREVVDRLGERSLLVRSEPSEEFVAACKGAWQALGAEIRERITASDPVMVCLDSQTELDQFPVELLHDGRDYLGLQKDVIRTPSLNDLNRLLCENRTNAEPVGSAILLRADDDLPQADDETELVSSVLDSLGFRPEVCRAPSQAELLDRLGQGVDLLHYVGHGLADEVGEELPLGPETRLPARAIEGLQPAPAPITVLSACLTGRSRQLKTGHEQGFATQLLRRGSPAVVAALYLVPDRLAIEFVELFYHLVSDYAVPSGLRETRRVLAEDGCHPAAWASFVVFGRPNARVDSPHASRATTWPNAAIRYLATGDPAYFDQAQALLSQDDHLPAQTRRDIATDLEKLAEGDAEYFRPECLSVERDFGDRAQAHIVDRLLRVFGLVRHARFQDHSERDRYERAGIGEALTASRILGDTYLHIAAVVELHKRVLIPGQRNMDALIASRRLRWLTGEGTRLSAAQSIVSS